METTIKTAQVEKQPIAQIDLDEINRHTLRELTAEEVFTFRLAACDNQVDRDDERFADETLEELARLYPGKPVLLDHNWSARDQTARIYGAAVEQDPSRAERKRLILRCYIPRIQNTRPDIEAIETGLKKECSVGCAVRLRRCSICGEDYLGSCVHVKGQEYAGQKCHVVLAGAEDAYEVSLVAVPAQKEAGVIKETGRVSGAWTKQARIELDLEDVRFGALRR